MINAKHGTNYKYQLGCKCAKCRQAHADYQSLGNSIRNARLKEAPHGTASGYVNWRCRCEACKAAHSAYYQSWRQRRKVAA